MKSVMYLSTAVIACGMPTVQCDFPGLSVIQEMTAVQAVAVCAVVFGGGEYAWWRRSQSKHTQQSSSIDERATESKHESAVLSGWNSQHAMFVIQGCTILGMIWLGCKQALESRAQCASFATLRMEVAEANTAAVSKIDSLEKQQKKAQTTHELQEVQTLEGFRSAVSRLEEQLAGLGAKHSQLQALLEGQQAVEEQYKKLQANLNALRSLGGDAGRLTAAQTALAAQLRDLGVQIKAVNDSLKVASWNNEADNIKRAISSRVRALDDLTNKRQKLADLAESQAASAEEAEGLWCRFQSLQDAMEELKEKIQQVRHRMVSCEVNARSSL